MPETYCLKTGKVSFQTKAQAKKKIAGSKMSGRLKGSLEPYLCGCGMWHLTSKPLTK